MRAFRPLEILVGLFLLFPITGAEAADEFEHVGTIGGQIRHVTPDARALAMGGAFTAIADGAGAAWWNPGALGVTSGPWVAQYSTRELLPGNDFRLHWVGLTGEHEGIGLGGHVTKFEDEYVWILASGFDVGRYVEEMPEGVNLGVGMGMTAYQEDYGDGNVRSWDMDLGAHFEWESPVEGGPTLLLRSGYVVRNLWNRKIDFGDADVLLGRRDRAAVALTAFFEEMESRDAPLKATLSLERAGLLVRAYDGEKAVDQIGAEVMVANVLALRSGHVWDRRNGEEWVAWGAGIGFASTNETSADFGVQFDFGSMDWITRSDIHQYALSAWISP